MPSDIRSFFGGKPAATASQDKKQEVTNPLDSHCINMVLPVLTLCHQKPAPKKTRGRKVVEDSEPEEEYAVVCQSHTSNDYTDYYKTTAEEGRFEAATVS